MLKCLCVQSGFLGDPGNDCGSVRGADGWVRGAVEWIHDTQENVWSAVLRPVKFDLPLGFFPVKDKLSATCFVTILFIPDQ